MAPYTGAVRRGSSCETSQQDTVINLMRFWRTLRCIIKHLLRFEPDIYWCISCTLQKHFESCGRRVVKVYPFYSICINICGSTMHIRRTSPNIDTHALARDNCALQIK